MFVVIGPAQLRSCFGLEIQSVKRATYILIAATLGPLFLALAVLMFYSAAQQPPRVALIPGSIGVVFLCIGWVAGTAIRGAFRTPPWWIVTPEKIHRSERLLLMRRFVRAAKRRVRLAEKDLAVAKKMVELEERLQKLESAKSDAVPDGVPAGPSGSPAASGGPPAVS